MVYLHKVDVKHHANKGDKNSAGQNGSVLGEEEHCIRQKPHGAGVYHHFAHGHFWGADNELPAKAGVTLTVQRDWFTANVSEGFVFHDD